MSLTLSTIITAARDKSPWFHRSRVTDAVLARHLSDVQNELIGAAMRRDSQYLAQTASIVVSLSDADAPGTAGAGTAGGVPGTIDADGNFATSESTAGSLIEANVTTAGGAQVWLTGRVANAATSTTITSTGASRTTNQDQGRVVVVTDGLGLGQVREIASNTADTWTVTDAWDTTPDDSSLFSIVTPSYGADSSIGAITGLPATTSAQGYLVKLDAQGVPYIDFAEPLVATIDAGVPLPAMQFPIDGTVWFTDRSSTPLRIVGRDERYRGGCDPAVYIDSQQVFLVGGTGDWMNVQSIALRYAPIAPAFTALTDTFLLPDHARPVLVAKTEAFMALRVSGMEGVAMNAAQLEAHVANSATAERHFLNNVTAAKGPRASRIRERW